MSQDQIDDEVGFFAVPGPISSLGELGALVADLPPGVNELAAIVRGLLIHDRNAAQLGIEFSTERDGMRTFGAGPTLRRIIDLEGAPLVEPRAPEERLIGYCYHFALLHCALLRSKGVPARARCGFAEYLIDGKWVDHWVTEYWHSGAWHLNDPQIGLDDFAAEHFRNGVQAWKLCRSGEADPFDHGNGELWGWDELRGSLVNDLGALNKIEIGDWDWCNGLKVQPLDQPSEQLDTHLDKLAALVGRGRSLDGLSSAFLVDALVRPPDHVIAAASARPAPRT